MSDTKYDIPALLESFKGKTAQLEDGTEVIIDTISHSFRYPTRAVINEAHFIEYLDLFAQMNGEEVTDIERAKWRRIIKKSPERR